MLFFQRDTTGLSTENSELKLRVQAMEQQAQLRDGTCHAPTFWNYFHGFRHLLLNFSCFTCYTSDQWIIIWVLVLADSVLYLWLISVKNALSPLGIKFYKCYLWVFVHLMMWSLALVQPSHWFAIMFLVISFGLSLVTVL